VTRLRAYLADSDASRIQTIAPGYLMQVAAGDLDLEIFNELSQRGADALAAGDWAAESELSAALALWRGNPLADVTSSLLQTTEVPRLAELRLQWAAISSYSGHDPRPRERSW
jgi:hypothetical protein